MDDRLRDGVSPTFLTLAPTLAPPWGNGMLSLQPRIRCGSSCFEDLCHAETSYLLCHRINTLPLTIVLGSSDDCIMKHSSHRWVGLETLHCRSSHSRWKGLSASTKAQRQQGNSVLNKRWPSLASVVTHSWRGWKRKSVSCSVISDSFQTHGL